MNQPINRLFVRMFYMLTVSQEYYEKQKGCSSSIQPKAAARVMLVVSASPFQVLSRTCSCVTYQEVEKTFLQAEHYWDFEQSLNEIKNKITDDEPTRHGNVKLSKSPFNNGIFLTGNDGTWLDLELKGRQGSCLKDPFTCTEQLTVAFLVKIADKPMPKEAPPLISEIFGPYGNVSEVNRPGVRVLYHQSLTEISVHVFGQSLECRCILSWSRNRWTLLVFTWVPPSELLVYEDGQLLNDRDSCSCSSKICNQTGPNRYRLGYEFSPVAWYDMIAIWKTKIDIHDLEKLYELMTDNGGQTVLSLSLGIPGLKWDSNYGNKASSEYTDLEQKLISNITFVDGMHGKTYHNNTELVTLQEIPSNSSHVKATLKISFNELKHTTAIELQEILENMLIGGQKTYIVECSSDDNFFCSIPTDVAVRPQSSRSIMVSWKTFTEGFHDNGYYRRHRFVYNISSTSNASTTWADTMSRGAAPLGGLKPYTHYCIRMAIESFKASGFFSKPLCTRTIQDVPSIPPIILSAYNTSHVSIFVEWNQTIPRKGWNGILIGYQVHWGTGKECFGLNDSYYNITTGLRPYRQYDIKVSGRTIKGPGKESVVQVRTAEWYPYNHPSNIRIFNTSQTSMKVTWSTIPISDQNGIIRGYTIEFFDMDFGQLIENVTVPPNVYAREYHNLSIYRLHGVRIKGFTVVGDGPTNDLNTTVARTEESVPVAAPDLSGYSVSAHSLLVEWQFNSTILNVLGVLLGFRVFLNGADNEPNFYPRIWVVAVPKANSSVIEGLWPHTEYNLSIAAYTRMGHGLVSQAILVRTDGKAPGLPPFPVHAHNTSSSSIQVSWAEVNQHYHHGLLLGYKVFVRQALQTIVTINKTVHAGTNTTDITGLKIYTRYEIKVLAFNQHGEGDCGHAWVTTDQDVPSRPPTWVKAWNTGSTSIQVSWQPINDSYYEHGVVLAYQVEYRRSDGRGGLETIIKAIHCPWGLSANITGLDEYVEYTITVQALNIKGIGPASSPVFCTTDEDVPGFGPPNLRGFNTSKSSIFVQWAPIPAHDINGVLLGYSIMYNITKLGSPSFSRRKRRSLSTISFTALVQPWQVNHTLYGLYPYSVYGISIAGYTRIGVGRWSAAVFIRTNDEEPQIPPPHVMAFNTSSTSINVTWLAIPPVLVAGILTSYIIKYTELDDQGNNVTSQIRIVPATQLSIALTDLVKYTDYNITVRGATIEIGVESTPITVRTHEDSKYTDYNITVRGATIEIGVESTPITVRTHEDTPSKPPQNVTVMQTSYYSLNVSWTPIPKPFIHGILRGYILFYKKTINDFQTAINQTILPNMTSYHVTDLESYTNYSIWMVGFTCEGTGNASRVEYGQTDEYVPSKAPVNVTALNFTSHKSINVSWHPIPHGFVHGILRGYRVLYKKIKTQDEEWSGKEVNYTVGPENISTTIEDLDNYAVYQIQVLGFTIKGDGFISKSIFAETCRCTKKLTTSWVMMEPYVAHNHSTSATSGLFPEILKSMVTLCCGNCYNGHGQSDLNLLSDGQGNPAQKSNETGLFVSNTELTFPVYGFRGKTSHGAYGYVNLVTSPGVSFITLTEEMTAVMFRSTMQTWPLIALMLAMMLLAGVLTWLFDSSKNPEHFPRPFITGSLEGCWLAFISITTVGYGDRAPRSFWARVLAIMNMLSGFILISLITANLSSDFVVTTIMADKKSLYLTKVGAITQSFEYRLAIRRNALVNTESEYYSHKALSDALISGEIQGILVDTYIATAHQELFAEEAGGSRITRQLLPYESSHGVALGPKTNKLHKCFGEYLKYYKGDISDAMERTLDQPSACEENAAKEMSSMIFDPSSKYFKDLYKYIGLTLLAAVLTGLACSLLLRRKNKKPLTTEQFQQIQRIQEKRQMVTDFYEGFSRNYHEMKRRHREQRLAYCK